MIPIWKLSGRLGNQMFQLAYLFSQVKAGEIPDIYLQDERYFANVLPEMRAMYCSDIRTIDMVSIHVRRGDYVGNKFYVDLWETGYYERAMAEFPGQKFLVFSDDIEWCKQHFKGDRFEFYHGTEVEDMNMMAGCKHNIIANSSFSWWAAWMNPNVLKKVIYPDFWYTDGIVRTVCPKSWKAL